TTVPAETSPPPADETDSTDTTDGEQSDTTAADGSDPAAPTTAPPEQTTTEAPSETTPAQPATDEEREQLQAAESAKAREVDAANVRLGVLTEALAVLQQDVEAQTAEVEIATRRLETAEAGLVAVNEDVAELEQTVVDLEIGLSNQAIRSFKGELLDTALIEVGRNPNQAMRMAAMLAKATESDIDFVNELAGAREVLLGRRADVERAALAAEESRQASQVQLAALEEDQQAQLALTFAAEDRLDHLLSERATLARLGADYNQSADEAALVQQLASAPAPAPTTQTSTGAGISTVTEADIRLAGNGIEVHVDIVEDIRQLLADAAADGVELAGGGYRDSAGQIRARRANCGTSNYAIYEMPSSQCSPPTARPGRSMHEQGKAIDFTYNGQLIRSRSGAGWNWLVANAAKYGLFNLPSEPWHWSTNGR
ncbi:MAG: D-alanyl-D-alanine carboxypeptidase family protein, partial [Actinomycetota bacterium]